MNSDLYIYTRKAQWAKHCDNNKSSELNALFKLQARLTQGTDNLGSYPGYHQAAMLCLWNIAKLKLLKT